MFDGNLIRNTKQINNGIWVRQNNNKWYVIWVHYSADPEKNPNTTEGKIWVDKAREGISNLDWDKEYEIDFFSKSGQIIYPDFNECHLVDPFEIPKHWTKFMAFDVGIRNPSAGLWCAISENGMMFLYREYYQRERVVKDHVDFIMASEVSEKIFARYIDPSAGNRSSIIQSSVTSEFARYGIGFIPSVNNSVSGISRITSWLKTDENDKCPKLRVFKNLHNFIYEIKHYRWEELKTDVYTKDPRDKPQKKNDHLMNCLEYLANENIRYYQTIPYEYENDWYMRSKRNETRGFGTIEGRTR